MNRDELVAGTRPEIAGGRKKIIMTSSDGFDGYEITEYKGMVWGISVLLWKEYYTQRYDRKL